MLGDDADDAVGAEASCDNGMARPITVRGAFHSGTAVDDDIGAEVH